MRTRRFCWYSYFKIGEEESTACCNVAVRATVCHIPNGIKLFYFAQDLTACLCPQCFGVGLFYLVVCHSGSRLKHWECLFQWLGWRCCSANTFSLLACWMYGLTSSLVCVKLTCLPLTLWLLQRCHVIDGSKRDLSCRCLACPCCR